MHEIYILLAQGFEEVEAITPADVLHRAGFKTRLVSTTNDLLVTGAHDITIKCNCFIDQVKVNDALMLILPGGMPGVRNLIENVAVKNAIMEFFRQGKWIGAICAAPMILGEMGLLNGKDATCYPGFEKYLTGAKVVDMPTVTSGKILTARGLGTSMDFSLEIVRNLRDKETANSLAKKMVVNNH